MRLRSGASGNGPGMCMFPLSPSFKLADTATTPAELEGLVFGTVPDCACGIRDGEEPATQELGELPDKDGLD